MCKVCANPDTLKTVSAMIAEGLSERAIAARTGISKSAINRHRVNHVVAPAKAILAVAGKAQDVRERQAELSAAIKAGEVNSPLAFVELENVVGDLRRVHERLERTADAAEQDKQRLVVASLSGQQLRAAEVRAKLGGHGGYAPQKSDQAMVPTFNFSISFGNGHVEHIGVTPNASVIDGSAQVVPSQMRLLEELDLDFRRGA